AWDGRVNAWIEADEPRRAVRSKTLNCRSRLTGPRRGGQGCPGRNRLDGRREHEDFLGTPRRAARLAPLVEVKVAGHPANGLAHPGAGRRSKDVALHGGRLLEVADFGERHRQ